MIVLTMTLLAVVARAQIPDEFKNLQVLDKNIDKRALVGQMREIAGALGVRCNYCHVGVDPNSLQGYDFTSDEKASKRTARSMLSMVKAINDEYLPAMNEQSEKVVKVSCVTCHRGQEKPRLIQDVLAMAAAEGGTEAVATKYLELRNKYYGRHTFDFSENVLSDIAQGASMQGNQEQAKELLKLNLEYYPEDAMTFVLLARIAQEQGDKTAAIGYFDKAIEYQQDEVMKERLRQMKKQVEAG
jgi:tetratricopeptide (TPR) repeat protein